MRRSICLPTSFKTMKPAWGGGRMLPIVKLYRIRYIWGYSVPLGLGLRVALVPDCIDIWVAKTLPQGPTLTLVYRGCFLKYLGVHKTKVNDIKYCVSGWV